MDNELKAHPNNRIVESTNNNQQRPTLRMSRSYGGNHSSSFLLRQGIVLPPTDSQTHRVRNNSTTIPGVSRITYSGYLYKRSNYPHRNPDELQQQQQQQQQNEADTGKMYTDRSDIPETPIISGMSSNTIATTTTTDNNNNDSIKQPLKSKFSPHLFDTTIAVTPSPASNTFTNEGGVESLSQPNQYESNFSPPSSSGHRVELKKNSGKNSIQLGLESAAAFFGIELKAEKKNNYYGNDKNNNDYTDSDHTKKSIIDDNEKKKEKIRQALLSTTVHPKKSSSPIKVASSNSAFTSSTKRTARLPIPTNISPLPLPSNQDRHQSSFHDAIHRRYSAPLILSESYSSSEPFHSSDSFGSKNSTANNNIPQDFYDADDGHLWRAKFCVLEYGILYFYRNANDGDSLDATAERKRSTCSMLVDDYYDNDSNSNGECVINNPLSVKNITGQATTLSTITPSTASAATKYRRRNSAQDLSKSPMIRPGIIHHLDSSGGSPSDIGTCIWEKRVFMDCVGGVRTAEQQFGYNSFELLAIDDDDDDQNLIDTLVLKAQNPIEMKEWIFQFHRSLASFMRNIIDVFGSTASSGDFPDIYHPGTMLSLSHSSRNLSSSSLIGSGSGSIPHSSSEKHLLRLLSNSPSLQQRLSHGHGRTSLKRRMDIKRTPSDSVSLSSTPETGDTDYSRHIFAFREPSPNNTSLSPESASLPSRFLIPPPVNRTTPAINKSSIESTTITPPTTTMIKSPLDDLLSDLLLIDTDIDRPKTVSGKYIPPHLRGNKEAKSKYIPPHLRSITPNTISQHFSDTAQLDQLDIIDVSTTGFIRGGCADPQLIRGSILDEEYIPIKASRLEKTAAEAYGSYGGSFSDPKKRSNSLLRWEAGAISECGIRESNEDAYLITNDLLNTFESGSYGSLLQSYWKQEETDHSLGLFAIFDGHCGNQAARFAVERLGRFIHHELLIKSNDVTNASHRDVAPSLCPSNIESILSEAIVKMDDEFCNLCQQDGREWESGATALVAMVANENLVIASLGDCRGVLCRFVDDDTSYESDDDLWYQLDSELDDLDQLSSETNNEREDLRRCFWREVTTVHSPSAEKERERIDMANGWITTETEIPMGQLRRMDFHDEDVIGILKRCLHYPSGNGTTSFSSERSVKECKAAPQRILHISRVCGELAVSRALGDRDFKAAFNSMSTQENDDIETNKQNYNEDTASWWESPLFLLYPDNHNRRFRGDLVTSTPDFHRVQLGKKGVLSEFLLFACDGLWDVMDADDAVRVVRDLLFRKRFTAKKAAARLAELAIHLGSSDNITVILVRLFSENNK